MAFADRPYYGEPPRRGLGGFRTPGSQSFTTWLIVANVAIFFLDKFVGRVQYGAEAGLHFSALVEWGHFSFLEGVQHLQVWRFFTYQFLHAGGWHLFGNMLMLFFFGSMVEQHLGSRRFLGYYLLCGVGGALLYLLLLGIGQVLPAERVPFLLVGALDTPLIGASACVMGVLIGAWRVAPDATVLLFFIIPMPLRVLILIVLLMDVYIVMTGGGNAGGSAAHLGGVVVGLALMANPRWLNFTERLPSMRRFSPDNLRRKAKLSSFQRNIKRQQDLEREVDRILEKVNREGLQSLSRGEKRTLQQATEKQRQE